MTLNPVASNCMPEEAVKSGTWGYNCPQLLISTQEEQDQRPFCVDKEVPFQNHLIRTNCSSPLLAVSVSEHTIAYNSSAVKNLLGIFFRDMTGHQ